MNPNQTFFWNSARRPLSAQPLDFSVDGVAQLVASSGRRSPPDKERGRRSFPTISNFVRLLLDDRVERQLVFNRTTSIWPLAPTPAPCLR